MSKYAVNLVPLQPWYFGGEKNFEFDPGLKGDNKNYYVKSRNLPQQSSLIGAIKLELIKSLGVSIKNDWNYNEEEQKIINTINHFEKIKCNNFIEGCVRNIGKCNDIVKSISPIMLNRNNDYYLSAPLDHDGKDKYYPREIESVNKIKTNFGEEIYVFKEEMTKKGLYNGWVNIETGKCINSDTIFKSELDIGIDINRKGKKKEKDYYKQEYKKFSKKFKNMSFCVICEIEGDIFEGGILDNYSGFANVGGRGSTFRINFKKVEDNLFEIIKSKYGKVVKNNCEPIKEYKKVVFISDFIKYNLPIESSIFALYELDKYREMKFDTKNMIESKGKLTKKSIKKFREECFNIIKAGAVFYLKDVDIEKLHNLGYQLKNGFNNYIQIDEK